jgi:Na+-transporting NADH:ubiquinone oxidoreductase subunit NqrF
MKKRIFILMLILVAAAIMIFVACEKQPIDEDEITISLDKTSLTLKVGETSTLVSTVSVNGISVSWFSSNTAVATVDKGTVAAIAEGTATITAKVSNISASCLVTVEAQEPVSKDPVITEEEGYGGEIYFSNIMDIADVNLCEGLSAKDYQGNALEVVVTDNGGFDIA